MKRTYRTIVLMMMAGIGCHAGAQNCAEIVRPYLESRNIPATEYPQPKFEWRCNFSHNSFYLCDSVPAGARVFEISELTHITTGAHPAANHAVDLEVFSYWAWDFINFQKHDYNNTIYFDTHNATNRYLAVRSYEEAYDRTERPERYKE